MACTVVAVAPSSTLSAEPAGFSGRGRAGRHGAYGLILVGWLAASQDELPSPPPRRPVVVKPVLIYSVPTRHPQTSWRNWGGIQTEDDATRESARIGMELKQIQSKADFPVNFLPVSPVKDHKAIKGMADVTGADVVLVYAAGGEINGIEALGKPVIFFLRHRSGPVSLWYEIVSPRYLRQHTDDPKITAIDAGDVVVDNLDELSWRLRSLCGLVNTRGARIVAVGGAGAWAHGNDVVTMVKKKWKLDIRELPYEELGSLIKAARGDRAAVALANRRTEAYLKQPGTQPGNGPAIRSERLPAGPDLPGDHGRPEMPGDHDQPVHGDDHAAGRDLGLPDPQHAQ